MTSEFLMIKKGCQLETLNFNDRHRVELNRMYAHFGREIAVLQIVRDSRRAI